jgi:preprotein translocase subunit SecE
MPEMVEDKEKQGQPSPAPEAAPAKPGARVEAVAKASVVLSAASWGAALAYGLSGMASMGASLISTEPALRPGGLAAGAGLAAFLIWLGLKRFGAHLKCAKPGLGRWVRGTGLAGVAVLAAFGAHSFYKLPTSTSVMWKVIAETSLVGLTVPLRPILFASIGLFGTVMVLAYALQNRESWANFLVETEGEVKKVSWPARKEYLGSALVVVVVIAVVSVFLWAADAGLSRVMQKMKIGF